MKKVWKIVVAVLLVLLVVIFSVMNTETIDLNLGFTTVSGPLIYVLLASFLIGVIVTLLLWLTTSFSTTREAKKLQAELDKINKSADERIANEIALSEAEITAGFSAKETELRQVKNELKSELVLKEQRINELENKLANTPPFLKNDSSEKEIDQNG